MVYHILREEILLIALNYLLSFRARKNAKQLVKYPRVLHFKTSKNVNACIIEVRDRGVKITTLLLDHNLSYEDNIYLLWKAAFLDIYIGKTVHL